MIDDRTCTRCAHPAAHHNPGCVWRTSTVCGCPNFMPRRIQRRRTKGWRMPEGAIYVGRPTRWGNPYVVHVHTLRCSPGWVLCPTWNVDTAEQATTKFRHALIYPLTHQPDVPDLDDIRNELRGHDLVCWCPLNQPCHADVLLELANA